MISEGQVSSRLNEVVPRKYQHRLVTSRSTGVAK